MARSSLRYFVKEITPPFTDQYYEMPFSSSLGFVILGTTHNFGRVPDIELYDPTGQTLFAQTQINPTTFDITIVFNRPQTGKIILT